MHKKKEQSAFLTADEGHAIIGKDKISRRAFYNALERDEIPSLRIGRRILLPRHAFLRWLQEGGAVPAPVQPGDERALTRIAEPTKQL
jgi:excisionase family DNA binding protein